MHIPTRQSLEFVTIYLQNIFSGLMQITQKLAALFLWLSYQNRASQKGDSCFTFYAVCHCSPSQYQSGEHYFFYFSQSNYFMQFITIPVPLCYIMQSCQAIWVEWTGTWHWNGYCYIIFVRSCGCNWLFRINSGDTRTIIIQSVCL